MGRRRRGTARGSDLLHAERANRRSWFTMSAIGTKRTCVPIRPMSAFGGKADIPIALRNVFDPLPSFFLSCHNLQWVLRKGIFPSNRAARYRCWQKLCSLNEARAGYLRCMLR